MESALLLILKILEVSLLGSDTLLVTSDSVNSKDNNRDCFGVLLLFVLNLDNCTWTNSHLKVIGRVIKYPQGSSKLHKIGVPVPARICSCLKSFRLKEAVEFWFP